MSFGNLWGYLYIPYLLLIITHCFTCGERKICSTIKNFQNIINIVVVGLKVCNFDLFLDPIHLLENEKILHKNIETNCRKYGPRANKKHNSQVPENFQKFRKIRQKNTFGLNCTLGSSQKQYVNNSFFQI